MKSIIAFIRSLFATIERDSPQATVVLEDVSYDDERHTLTIKNLPGRPIITTVKDTNSMDPLVDAGHIIILQPEEDHRVGDVVMYASDPRYFPDSQFILHRIVGEQGDKWITRGDNNRANDPLVHKRNVIARLKMVFY